MKFYKPAFSDRRLDTLNEIYDGYMHAGTHMPQPEHVPFLQSLLDRARSAPNLGSPESNKKANFLGWLHYEIGLASQTNQPQRAFRHYVQAEQLLPVMHKQHKSESSQAMEHQKNRELIGLLRSRLDPNERLYGLQQKAVAGALGKLIVTGVRQAREAATPSERNDIRGIISETAIAATLLLPGECSTTLIPAPASPRQDAPWQSNGMAYRHTIRGIQTSHAVDLNLLTYTQQQGDSGGAIPAQIKTHESPDDNERYDPSILMLYADRDLFVDSLSEFNLFGQSLSEYARTREVDTRLATARSNIELAYEIHVGTSEFID